MRAVRALTVGYGYSADQPWLPGLPHVLAALATYFVFGGRACVTGLLLATLASFVVYLPVTALTLGSFATITAMTKNSFLDEINKSYVLTARMNGLTERGVLYGHMFRNSMMIVIAGFPGAFVGAFLGGSLLIENIFSLNGLGRMSYEAVMARDYPIVFANIYVYALIGVVVNLVSDLTYNWVDPRVDFERREV